MIFNCYCKSCVMPVFSTVREIYLKTIALQIVKMDGNIQILETTRPVPTLGTINVPLTYRFLCCWRWPHHYSIWCTTDLLNYNHYLKSYLRSIGISFWKTLINETERRWTQTMRERSAFRTTNVGETYVTQRDCESDIMGVSRNCRSLYCKSLSRLSRDYIWQ